MKLVVALACLALLCSCRAPGLAPLYVKHELAPSGTLRAAINFGNPVLAQRDPVSGEPRGVSVDLARELSWRLNVPVEFIPYDWTLNAQ